MLTINSQIKLAFTLGLICTLACSKKEAADSTLENSISKSILGTWTIRAADVGTGVGNHSNEFAASAIGEKLEISVNDVHFRYFKFNDFDHAPCTKLISTVTVVEGNSVWPFKRDTKSRFPKLGEAPQSLYQIEADCEIPMKEFLVTTDLKELVFGWDAVAFRATKDK